MKKVFLPLSAFSIFLCLLLFIAAKAGNLKVLSTSVSNAFNNDSTNAKELVDSSNAARSLMSAVEVFTNKIYDSLNLDHLGLSKEALVYAIKGEERLASEGILNNSDIITICDFSQPSSNKRMYIIDLKNYKVLMNTYVAHGKNSGLTYAERFSNAPESLESSLGFYVTKNTYIGKHGLSLRLSGLDDGFNDNAESRAVVVHGAQYIGSQRAEAAYMGRSFGCPAVPQSLAPKVINLIKDGTCLFIYHPSDDYLNKSKILNG